MRIVIVEDEAIVARRLTRLLREILGDRLESLEHLPSLERARPRLASEPRIDALFLDLNLNGRDGFDLLREATAGAFHTVVVSAHAERALEAFDHGVLDFVAKPYGRERLALAVQRLLGQAPRQVSAGASQLAVRRSGRVVPVSVASLVRIEGAGDYARLVLEDGTTYLHDKTLDALEALLPDRFVRVHRSALVDGERIEELISEPGSRYFVRLRGGERVRVGRSRVGDVRGRWV